MRGGFPTSCPPREPPTEAATQGRGAGASRNSCSQLSAQEARLGRGAAAQLKSLGPGARTQISSRPWRRATEGQGVPGGRGQARV
jgi:hypothetical protein